MPLHPEWMKHKNNKQFDSVPNKPSNLRMANEHQLLERSLLSNKVNQSWKIIKTNFVETEFPKILVVVCIEHIVFP